MIEHRFTVGEDGAGARLDVWLAVQAQPLSRSALYRRIGEGAVRVNEAIERLPRRPLAAGDEVVLALPPPAPVEDPAEPIPLDVILEDPDLLVVNKPAGLVTHPAYKHARGTLLNAILHRCAGQLSVGGAQRPGFVQRLDRGTSGVMVVAKTDRALRGLAAQLRHDDAQRRYLALADGAPPDAGTFDTLHGRSARDRRRFTTRPELLLDRDGGRRAVTHFRAIERFDGAALVEITLDTGRTHQIRVHFAEAGFPLLGDPIYGRPSRTPWVRGVAARLGRPALHAASLAFAHPITGAPLRFDVEPPDDLRRALASRRRPAAVPSI